MKKLDTIKKLIPQTKYAETWNIKMHLLLTHSSRLLFSLRQEFTKNKLSMIDKTWKTILIVATYLQMNGPFLTLWPLSWFYYGVIFISPRLLCCCCCVLLLSDYIANKSDRYKMSKNMEMHVLNNKLYQWTTSFGHRGVKNIASNV